MVQEVSAKSQKTLKTYYYDKGFTYGRDGLFELLDDFSMQFDVVTPSND